MKKKLLFTFVIFWSYMLCAQEFIHTTYMVGNSLKNVEQIRQIDYQKFQYIYLMAAPKWVQEDFTQPQKNIIQKLVTEHQYTKDQNIEMIPLLIEEAHKNGTKVLLSFPGKEDFTKKVSSIQQQSKLIDMMIQFIDKYNYDGIEID